MAITIPKAAIASATHNKPGRQETHIFQKRLLKTFTAPIVIIRDFIAAGLRRQKHIWRNCFEDKNRVENFLCRAWDMFCNKSIICNYTLWH